MVLLEFAWYSVGCVAEFVPTWNGRAPRPHSCCLYGRCRGDPRFLHFVDDFLVLQEATTGVCDLQCGAHADMHSSTPSYHKKKLSLRSPERHFTLRVPSLFTRDGLLGVDGQYFDSILFCREVVGTALQTHQAYRMSVLLPRVQINRVYVALLVASCWTTALVHSVFHTNSVKRRVWSLVSDCVLDTVTAMGISTVLLATYINDFDFTISGFPFYKWYEDIWVVHATSEFQIILVTSWRDLCTRMVFALSLLSDLDSLKMAMRVRRRTRTSSCTSSGKNRGHRATLVAPYFASAKSRSGPGMNILRRRHAIEDFPAYFLRVGACDFGIAFVR